MTAKFEGIRTKQRERTTRTVRSLELGPGRALRLLLSRALSSRLAAFSMLPRRGGDKTNHRKEHCSYAE